MTGSVRRHGSAKAYVAGHTALTPVDLATGKIGKPLPSLADPIAIAISPDGRTAYAANLASVIPIQLAARKADSPITVPDGAYFIAITP
jgi:DNA-binding beta-propeller fold protein YncE